MVNAKVFIVDDDEAVRDSLRMLLESCGMDVEDFASTRDFMRKYRPGAHECLLLDQHLPEFTGLEFLASPERGALRLPVILLTGRGDGAIRDRAYELGVRAYLEKPVPDDILLKTIGQAIS